MPASRSNNRRHQFGSILAAFTAAPIASTSCRKNTAVSAKDTAVAAKDTAITARDLTLNYRDQAGTHAGNAASAPVKPSCELSS